MVVSIVTFDNRAIHRELTSAVANGPFNFPSSSFLHV